MEKQINPIEELFADLNKQLCEIEQNLKKLSVMTKALANITNELNKE